MRIAYLIDLKRALASIPDKVLDVIGWGCGEGCEEETFKAINDIRVIAQKLNISLSQLSLAWILHQSFISSILMGVRKPKQMKENIKSLDIILSNEILNELKLVTSDVKTILGFNPDFWKAEGRIQ